LIGYDDIQLALYTSPPLTTIRIEKEWLGAQGVWQLLERIAHPEMPPRQTFIGVSLIERQSVKQSEKKHSSSFHTVAP
jgi:LacI family transcriptional regulator